MELDKRKAPLRKIVRQRSDITLGLTRDVLECGHELNEAQDLYGPRFPERRRCWKCLKEMDK